MSNVRFAYTPEQLREFAADTLQRAREYGASSCELDISEGYGHSITVRMGEVETIEYNRDKGMGVTVYVGQRKGYASTSDFSREAFHQTVDAALSIARFTASDEAAGLADAELMACDVPDLDLYHPWDISADEAIELAKACEAAGMAVDDRIKNSEGGSVSVQQSQFLAANSLGFMAGYPASRHYISCSVIAEQDDMMQRDDWYTSARASTDLMAAAQVGRIAGERAVRRLGARQISTREVPVLFEAQLAHGLIGHFVQGVSGGSLYRKSSFLVDSLGKQIFSPLMNITEDPRLPRGLASAAFDDDGVVTRAREVVSDGMVNGYFLSTYSARKLGMQTTGNAGGSHNLIVRPGDKDFQGLLREMGQGLLVTELIGQGINMVTGDYSRGAAGYWVENGEIQYPVEEITIAGNLADMFKSIVAIGNDMLVRGSKQCGSILIERMTVAGD